MKLATFTQEGIKRPGIVIGEEIVDLAASAPDLPRDMVTLLQAGEPALEKARAAAERATARVPLDRVHLDAPIQRPPKFLAIAFNYAAHVAETGSEKPSFPTIFNKQSTCVTGPTDPIHRPRVSDTLDYEGELGFVIGRPCRHVPAERAADVIAGYLIVNDVTVREWQMKAPTMTLGKSFDTHGPIGPWMVTPDEIGNPHALTIRTWVNGELRQDSNTGNLILNCFEMVAALSAVFTLEAGDIISTGTPAGVGVALQPPRFLAAGDVVRVEIERIGHIENPVIDEPEETQRL